MNTLEFRLRKYGCRVLKLHDARTALSTIHNGGADILVSSVETGSIRLLTLVQLIREDFKSTIPIIIVAEPDVDTDIIMEGIDAGADDFVTFPFKPIELVLRIKLLLHRAPFSYS